MTEFHGKDYGIFPSQDATEGLKALFKEAVRHQGSKKIILEKGTYFIDSGKCNKYKLYISNTVGDGEFTADETPHLQAVAFYLENISDFVFDGNGSTFVIDGKATNIAITKCKNITIKNLEIRHAHPDMHELRVVGKKLFSVDFEIDKDSRYEFDKGKLYFYGNGYRVRADKNAEKSDWIGLIKEETPNRIKRTLHPLAHKFKIRDIGGRKIRVYYPSTIRFKLGDCYYPYDVRRQFAGIFLQQSENITIEHIAQRFNYSLAYVAQDCENLTVNAVDFSPEKGSVRKMASIADFFQFSMCRGAITVCNSNFCGAGDDCLNVHGIHFKIAKKAENKLTLSFMHHQTHGFNPLRIGDTLACIDIDTLLEKGQAKILSSELIDEYNIVVTVDKPEAFAVGHAVEDINACPSLSFKKNKLTRIITRGLLITTRGKVEVKNNIFESTSMSAILLSDDAKSWYESGMCKDVTIKNNTFLYSGETPILIKPENSIHKSAVHSNIKIIENSFEQYSGECISAKSTDFICIKGNSFGKKDFLKAENCLNIETADNQ